MHPLTKTAEVLAVVAAGGTIGPGERQGLLGLVDRAGNGVPAWQTALRAAANKLGQAVQFKIRMPGLLKQQLEEAAGNARRSVSAEIIHRLENSLADAVATTSVIECPGLPPVALAPARAGRTYIAGPMTGLPDFNHPAFNAADAALRAQGRTVINPADHGVVAGAAWADYVRADLALLASCETIYLLPGWSRSRGAMLEQHVARALAMPIEFADGAEVEAEGQMQADHARLNELSGNSEQLAPAIDLEQLRERFADVLQDEFDLEACDPEHAGHDDGRTEGLRIADRLLALIDGQAGSHASDEQYADADALVAHLASLMDDGGQGGEHWEPAKAAIAGIRAWQAGELELPDLCDMCRTRQEVRSDAEGIPFCQECWDGWQAEEAKAVQS